MVASQKPTASTMATSPKKNQTTERKFMLKAKSKSFKKRIGSGSMVLPSSEETTNEETSFPPRMVVISSTLDSSSGLKREKEILCRMRSDYVIKCYGDGTTETEDGEKLYSMFLEYGSDYTLFDRIKEVPEGLPEDEVRCLTRDILKAISHIHCKGFVHCNLSPSNILLVPNIASSSGSCGFTAKVAEFHWAKGRYSDDEKVLFRRTRIRYMSPELVRYNDEDQASDIWALGCTVVELMTGKPIWGNLVDDEGNSNIQDILSRIAFSPEVAELPSNISEEGKDFVDKCMVKNPDYRWAATSLLDHPFLAKPTASAAAEE